MSLDSFPWFLFPTADSGSEKHIKHRTPCKFCRTYFLWLSVIPLLAPFTTSSIYWFLTVIWRETKHEKTNRINLFCSDIVWKELVHLQTQNYILFSQWNKIISRYETWKKDKKAGPNLSSLILIIFMTVYERLRRPEYFWVLRHLGMV